MNPLEVIRRHHALCDEIHAVILAENRFLRQYQQAPEAALTERKRALLAKLDESLASLRALPAGSVADKPLQSQLETTRSRILQILQLDKENEQLLLRSSLNATRAPSTAQPSPSAKLLQKIYARSA